MQIKGMGGFLDGIDFIDYYRQMDKMDGMGNMRQDKPQKKRDTCW